jgi:polysaccharide pyruvyl transferase CsaB
VAIRDLSLPTIGLAGSYGGLNTGDEAILTVVIAQLRAAIPGARIVVFSRDPGHTRSHHVVDQVVAAREASRGELVDCLGGLDLLLLGGGGLLYDREAESYLHVVRTAQKVGVPTATYAIGAGPLERPADRMAVAEVLNRMELVTVREATSRRLLEEIGVEREVVVTADPALLLEPALVEHSALDDLGDGRRLVGLSVRERGGASAESDGHPFHTLLATAADFIVERFDAHAVFVPMERGDIGEAHRVIGEMARPECATVLRGPYDPPELRAIIGQFEMAIGMRLHFLIFAASAGVPVAALPYASKVRSFLDSIGLPGPEPSTATHAGHLLAAIDRLWDLRVEQQRCVAGRLPGLREAATRTTTLTAELLRTDAAAAREA